MLAERPYISPTLIKVVEALSLMTRDESHPCPWYPALNALALSPTDLANLHTNDGVYAERRGNRVVYKLRFRNGRQVVRCLRDSAHAEKVKAELAESRMPQALARALREAAESARRKLCIQKQLFAPILASVGLKFHGRDIRRPHRISRPFYKG